MSNFVLTLELKTEKWQEDILDKRFNIGRQIYNACLGELYKRYNTMTQRKEYNKVLEMPRDKDRNKEFNKLNKKYGLTEYSLHKYVKPMQHYFKKNIDSFTAQKIATRAFRAFEKYMFLESKRVYFKKYGELNSLEGKSNGTGIKFQDNKLVWNKLEISAIIKKSDEYAQMALENKIKYCRILRKFTRDKYKYYIQLMLEGVPPIKINKKTGKYNKKKRFGKSLANKAPSMFLTILDNKLKFNGEELYKIDTWSVKASQYNHIEDKYIKKDLNERWNDFGDYKIQRDLYSSFLIMNVKNNLKEIDRGLCFKTFDNFKTLHDKEIERIKHSNDKTISSMGI